VVAKVCCPIVVLFLIIGIHYGAAQIALPEHQPVPPEQQRPRVPGEEAPDLDQNQQQQERERQKKFNAQRHESLKRDTDRLLLLATELKQAVDKSNEHTLSVDVVNKAAEIEKLAKNVKNKMKAQ
jgi:hypothetical protein